MSSLRHPGSLVVIHRLSFPAVYEILVPRLGIKLSSLPLTTGILNHWTTKEVPGETFLKYVFLLWGLSLEILFPPSHLQFPRSLSFLDFSLLTFCLWSQLQSSYWTSPPVNNNSQRWTWYKNQWADDPGEWLAKQVGERASSLFSPHWHHSLQRLYSLELSRASFLPGWKLTYTEAAGMGHVQRAALRRRNSGESRMAQPWDLDWNQAHPSICQLHEATHSSLLKLLGEDSFLAPENALMENPWSTVTGERDRGNLTHKPWKRCRGTF